MWIFTWSLLIKVFSLYQKHCFPGLKLTDFYFYGQDIILFLTIFQQIFLLRLNAINCAYCLSITMHFRYAVKSNRTIIKREVTKSFVSIFCCYCHFHDCLSCKAWIEAQNVRESWNLVIYLVTPIQLFAYFVSTKKKHLNVKNEGSRLKFC